MLKWPLFSYTIKDRPFNFFLGEMGLYFIPSPKILSCENKNRIILFLHEKSVNFFLDLTKNFSLKTAGSDYSLFESFRTNFFPWNVLTWNFFLKKQHTKVVHHPTPSISTHKVKWMFPKTNYICMVCNMQ
jgi:hypothetical protein